MKRQSTVLLALVLASAFGLSGCKKKFEPPTSHERTFQWPKETLALAATLPLQEGGRVKPFSTFAGFQLLKINGKRKLKVESGETLLPTAWLLDCMFFPEQAKTYDCFRLDDTDLLTRIGLTPRLKPNGQPEKRGNYSFKYLEKGLPKLMELAGAFSKKSQAMGQTSLDSIERQVLELAGKVRGFHELLQAMHFARAHYHVRESAVLKRVFKEGEKEGHLSEVLRNAEAMFAAFQALRSEEAKAQLAPERIQEEMGSISDLFTSAKNGAEQTARLAFFPSPDLAPAKDPGQAAKQRAQGELHDPAWLSVGDLFHKRFDAALKGEENRWDAQIAMLAAFEALEAKKKDPAEFTAALQTFRDATKARASERSEWWKIPLEIHYYKADWFYRALIFYMLAFLIVIATWFFPQNKRLYWVAWGALLLSTLLVVIGIAERCVIRSRPPVSTLYETILFITASVALLALVIEWINRQRVALSLAPVLGAMGMFLAMRYEFREAVTSGDTMGSLVAVLDTNFWLATHVTTVTLGYGAGLLAAGIAHIWLVAKAADLGDRTFHRVIVRMVYGVLCFGLLFSVVGTILGGIWANDSWGRFWGWDPKENGALMIVLWELAILHARLGGYIRDLGLCIAAVLGGCVVAFSWWGVNLLSVGLHSYGFTEGAAASLNAYYGIEVLFVLITGVMIYARASAVQAVKNAAVA